MQDVEGHYRTLLPLVVARVLAQQHLLQEKQQAEDALRQTLAELERRVQERTIALQHANTHLRAEIAERQRAEDALVQLNRRHRRILDAAGEGIDGINPEGCITFVNPAAARLLGGEGAELRGQRIQDSVCHTRRDGTPCAPETCAMLVACREGVVHHVREDVCWRHDGTSVLVEDVSTPLREHGELVGAGVLFRDRAARKRLEQDRQHADRLALVGHLASGLAHEIGTPLNIIAGTAELLGMDLRAHHLGTAEVETIIRQADRITRLIQQLLNFARARDQAMSALLVQEPLANALR